MDKDKEIKIKKGKEMKLNPIVKAAKSTMVVRKEGNLKISKDYTVKIKMDKGSGEKEKEKVKIKGRKSGLLE